MKNIKGKFYKISAITTVLISLVGCGPSFGPPIENPPVADMAASTIPDLTSTSVDAGQINEVCKESDPVIGNLCCYAACNDNTLRLYHGVWGSAKDDPENIGCLLGSNYTDIDCNKKQLSCRSINGTIGCLP